MTTQDKATSRAESGEAVEVLLDGFRLVKESALDRLRMDDEIVSIVDYHANKARALLASRPAPADEKALRTKCEALAKKWDEEMGREDWAPNFAEELRAVLAHEAPKDESAKTVPMESGWLIETKSQPPLWWNGRPKRDGDCAWGTANQAIRFVRKADAELCLLAQGYSLAHNHAIEHGWG